MTTLDPLPTAIDEVLRERCVNCKVCKGDEVDCSEGTGGCFIDCPVCEFCNYCGTLHHQETEIR